MDFLTRDLLQFFEENRILGLIADIVNVDVSQDAFLIDYEDRALGNAFLSKDVIFQCNHSVWPEIAQQRVGNSTQ